MKEWQEETAACFLGPIYPYFRDPEVSEILVNGPSSILIEKGGRLHETTRRFDSVESLSAAIVHIAQLSDGVHRDGQLIVEGRLPDGSRVEAVLPPAARGGPYLSIRRFSRGQLGMEDLVALGSVSGAAHELLRQACDHKRNLLVAGGTGTGKTSLLNALASFIDSGERVVCIEDTPELQLDCPHLVSLCACHHPPSGGDSVGIRELFKATLRLRPDRIVIGEIRGGEALELVQAMTSGHGGCLSTIHASHPADALRRLETLALMSDVDLPLAALQRQVASAVDLVLQLERRRDGRRVLSRICQVRGVDDAGRYQLETLEEMS